MEQSTVRRLINANRAAFLLAGYGISTWAPLIPIVQSNFGLDPHQLGLLLLCVGIGGFFCMPFSGIIAGKIGCRAMSLTGMTLMTCGLLGVVLSSHVYTTAAMLLLMGFAGVLLDVSANINAARLEQMTGRSFMSGLHGIYSVGCIMGTMCVTLLLSAGFEMLPAEICALVLFVLIAIIFCRGLLNRQQSRSDESLKHDDAEGDAAAVGAKRKGIFFLPGAVIVMGLMCFVMFSTEGSMLDWSGVFLKNERGVSFEHAGWGYAAFSTAMTIFRLTGDRIVTAMGRRRVLVGGTLCIFAGYLLVVGVDSLAAALAGYFVIGLGASNIVPQLISYSASIKGISINAAVTAVNAIGYVGGLAGPALIGFSAQACGLAETFMLQACLVLCVGAGCFVLLKRKKTAEKDA